MTYDAIIVGGSYAGLAAALQLARARRKVMVVDAGIRRNRFAATSHGFLGQDGRDPVAIAADARAQLLAYPSVDWIEGSANTVGRLGTGFEVGLDNGDRHAARRLILATGVTDDPPAVPGLAERWGKSVFHCPYCHGYELDGGQVGVLASSAHSMHHALMLPDWGSTTFFLNGAFIPDAEQMEKLRRRGVTIESTAVARIMGDKADIELEDGRVVPLDGLFTLTRTQPSSPLADRLGCAMEEGPMGPFISTSATKETSVPGLFACGDAARAAGSVTLAVGDGAMAGMGVHQSLIFRDA